jgi:MORN repeat variant
MKKLISLLLLILSITSSSFACRCSFQTLTTSDLKNFRYIALVKIKTFQPSNVPTHSGWNHSLEFLTQTAKFTVEYIENFKGSMPTEFIMTSYNSSCDPGIREGQVWLLFSNEEEGYPTIHPCGFSEMYSDKNGEINKYYSSNLTDLALVRNSLKSFKFEKTGLLEEIYQNRRTKYLENYSNNLLDGKRLFWYENGNVKGEEYFKNGKRDGISKWWFENGKPSSEAKYKDGVLVDTSWVWYQKEDSNFKKIDSTYLRLFTIYKNGSEYNKRAYYDDGKLYFEQILVGNGDIKLTNIWEKDGSLDILTSEKWNKEKQIFEVEYSMDYRSENGKRRVFYYKNGDYKNKEGFILYPYKN